jgi:hypothetical protein
VQTQSSLLPEESSYKEPLYYVWSNESDNAATLLALEHELDYDLKHPCFAG